MSVLHSNVSLARANQLITLARPVIVGRVFASSQSSQRVFDRRAKAAHRAYAISRPDSHVFDYLKDEFGYRLADKLFDIKSTCLQHNTGHDEINILKVQADEEALPFRSDSIDLIISNLTLHWVNRLPATIQNVLTCLKPDGVFIGCLFGGQTLYQLRCSLQLAELEREGGFGPHISPFVEPSDVGALLSHAGFNMLTIDSDEITIVYPSMFELMHDLKGMGENNAAWNRRLHLRRDTMFAAAAIYEEMYGIKDGQKGIPATFHVYNFIGWKPHASQPKAKERGSANFSIKDIHNLDKFVIDSKKVSE